MALLNNPLSNYIVGKSLGRGTFGQVWHGRHKVHGTEVAIKAIQKPHILDEKNWKSLHSEISIMQRINHPNIVRLYEVIQTPVMIYLVLEYCDGKDLSSYIQRHGRVPEANAKHFMQQLACGLRVLRVHQVIHRDLKPQNLLLSGKDKSVLKIADFGLARHLQPWNHAQTYCGTPLYMAPEVMQGQMYDAKADLWSVGAILFELVTGRAPQFRNIMGSNKLQFPSDSPSLSSECKDLCQKLLRHNPVERMNMEEFFNHPFLSQKQPEWNNPLRNRNHLPFFLGDNPAQPPYANLPPQPPYAYLPQPPFAYPQPLPLYVYLPPPC